MQFLLQPFPWYIAGPLIAINLFLLLYFGQRFGISTGLKTTCAALGAGSKVPFFNYDWKKEDWLLIYTLGTLIGGFLAFQFLHAGDAVIVSDKTKTALDNLGIASNQSFEPDFLSTANIFTLKGFSILLGGGLLIGFGTRWANGCTSGHAISGLSDLQLPSLVAVIGFFIGGLVMTHFLIPVILK
jgi:uncharacterized membrane protein YedE/YeeE